MNINIPDKFWKVVMFAGLMFSLFLIAGTIRTLKSINYVGTNPNQTDSIDVSGTGYAYAIPDIATFSFTVTDTEKAVADAQAKATDEANAALKTVRDAGVADKDIQTTYYSISPHYEYQNAVCPTPAVYNGTGSSGSVAYCPPGQADLDRL